MPLTHEGLLEKLDQLEANMKFAFWRTRILSLLSGLALGWVLRGLM